MARVEHINEKIVDFFAETDCKYIAMGLECGDEEFRRKHLNRFMTNKQIEDAFGLILKKGIFATSFNMIGYPFEYDKDLTDETVKLNKKIKPSYSQISIFYPFQGTAIYRYCEENDLIDKEKINNLSNYFSDSPLKGITLKEKRNEISWILNPDGF